MFKKIIIVIALATSSTPFAHEGHKIPGTLKSNHGGVVKPGKIINLEYVVTGSEVTLFPLSHEGEDLAPQDVKLSATTKLPKGKNEVANVEFKDGKSVIKVDFKNSHRVEMNVEADTKGKKSTFKFQVEK